MLRPWATEASLDSCKPRPGVRHEGAFPHRVRNLRATSTFWEGRLGISIAFESALNAGSHVRPGEGNTWARKNQFQSGLQASTYLDGFGVTRTSVNRDLGEYSPEHPPREAQAREVVSEIVMLRQSTLGADEATAL